MWRGVGLGRGCPAAIEGLPGGSAKRRQDPGVALSIRRYGFVMAQLAGVATKIVRVMWWLIAALPIAAACYWASFAARMPEALANRIALGEVTPRWEMGDWANVVSEPMHVLARLVHLVALQIPGATIASVVWVNLVLALLLVVLLVDVLRRAFPMTGSVGPLAFVVFGLLVASPSFGTNWLHGQRVGIFAVPVLFVLALTWLQTAKTARIVMAFVLAGLAPWFHVHGAVVATALIPAALCATTAAGSQRRMIWIGVLLLLGDAGAILTMQPNGGLAATGVDWLGSLTSDPSATVMALMTATGNLWLDLLPGTDADALALGSVSWLLPVALVRLGNRSPEARAAAAPWWSCLLFGLLVVVVNAIRYELDPPAGTLREAMFGAFLLPIGLIGVLAARFGPGVLTLAAGAVVVLAVQDWRHGIEDLRVAFLRAEQVEASTIIPESARVGAPLPTRTAEQFATLVKNGWVPDVTPVKDEDVFAQFEEYPIPGLGSLIGGKGTSITGSLRSSLRVPGVQWIAIVGRVADEPLRIVGHMWPRYVNRDRDVQWEIVPSAALPRGMHVRAVALLVRERKLVAIGQEFMMFDGALMPANGG